MKRRTLKLILVWSVVLAAWLLGAVAIFNFLQKPTLFQPPVPLMVVAQNASKFRDCICPISSSEEARYVLYTPPDYNSARSYPLIVFLHGRTKEGTDGRSHLADGPWHRPSAVGRVGGSIPTSSFSSLKAVPDLGCRGLSMISW